MRSIGGRFHAQARVVATPASVGAARRARCSEDVPPSGRSSRPSRIRKVRCALVPSSSNAKLANSLPRVGS